MRTSLLQPFLIGAGFGAMFLLGQLLPIGAAPAALHAQGRGPVNAPPDPHPPPDAAADSQPVVVTEDGGGGAASNNGFVAVTGSYGVGTSVLYLVDTVNRQLAVYEARGGGMDQRRIVLVGARRIDLDLQLRSYNDRSEYEYDRLERLFQRGGKTADPDVKTGLEPANGRK
jgi:NADPH-dependent 2,4-dienoyl-CoA reductase/sulfur reductase-like enzyme